MKSRILLYYGLAIYVSGFGRFLLASGGEKGLWFGLVTGSLSLAASWLFAKGKSLFGGILAALSIAFTGGWYAWECFMIKGFADAEWRQLSMVVVSLFVTVLLVGKCRKVR